LNDKTNPLEAKVDSSRGDGRVGEPVTPTAPAANAVPAELDKYAGQIE